MSAGVRRIAWAPEWASAWGEDEYGLFAEFEYAKVVQRMRWIPPGRFLMGSPEDEPERDDDELQHEVQLTEGYWLADTACTQELWSVVMGENPSQFKEREEDENSRPVEQVSWDDCQTFLQRLNALVPGLEFRLPTEAEWEYACRAGTTTAFSFGRNITQEQVNFGFERGKTVPVKSLPANPWGLFEMHGNVYEWCLDKYAPYKPGLAIDPTGVAEAEGGRVIRGGSWDYYARWARSALRYWARPGGRDFFLGFRIARGRAVQQEKPASKEGARGPRGGERSEPERGPRATGGR